jgi:RNA recognition motif-containing protein
MYVTVEELENMTSYQRHPNKCDVDEYHLRASRTLFIGALEKDVTDDDLFKIFAKFGRILVNNL